MATNHVYCSYQEVIDLHTEGNHVTVIGVHTPTGNTPYRMFKGLFDQFKQYRYNGCSIKLVPAARLPVDPLNVSVDPGQVLGTKVDPRDALNPLMFHGCHGNDMGTILNKLYGTENVISDSMDGLDAPSSGAVLPQEFRNVLERLYYKALTDNSWKKAGSQRGFMKSGLRPLVYSLAANRQIMPGTKGMPITVDENGNLVQNLGDPMDSWQLEDESLGMPVNKSTLQLMTPRLTGLGWLDTKNVLTADQDLQVATLTDAFVAQENYTQLPKIFMGVILLPPAYGVEQYFRMIINHSFTFRKFRGISFKPEMPNVPSYFNANEDLFDPEKYDGQVEPDPDPEPDPGFDPTTGYQVTFGVRSFNEGTSGFTYLCTGSLSERTLAEWYADKDGSSVLAKSDYATYVTKNLTSEYFAVLTNNSGAETDLVSWDASEIVGAEIVDYVYSLTDKVVGLVYRATAAVVNVGVVYFKF